jgi:hypothetical protein
MVHAGGVRRLKPSGTKPHYEVKPPPLPRRRRSCGRHDASETSPCRRTGEAKRPARPPQGDGVGQARRRGDRDPQVPGATGVGRVGAVSAHSAVGPHRLGDGSTRSHVVRSPGRGPIHTGRVGRVPQRGASGSSPRCTPREARSPDVPQLGRQLPTPGRRSPDQPIRFRSWVPLPWPGVLLLARRHDARNRFGSKGTCLRHR